MCGCLLRMSLARQRVFLSDAGQFLTKIYQSAVSNKFAGGAKSEQRNKVLAMLHDTGKLQQGIKELLQAASARFTPADQEMFLKAALFGKSFVNKYRTFDPQLFKNHATEVAKELQQQAMQPNFHQGGQGVCTGIVLPKSSLFVCQSPHCFLNRCVCCVVPPCQSKTPQRLLWTRCAFVLSK